tara:strand:- start:209 stop:448 length:240 start_codon:yes stop_codon:yes gene_type:complete
MGKQNEKLLENMNKLDKVMDYKLIDNIEVDGIDTKDYPDFCDAYIVSADYDGKPMTDEQLDTINDDGDFQHECIMNDLH